MATNITMTVVLSYFDDEMDEAVLSPSILDVTDTASTKRFLRHKQNVGFAADEALFLGDISSLGWLVGINRDEDNNLLLLTGTSGSEIAVVRPGKSVGPIYLGADMQAPFVQAVTAAVQFDYLLLSR